MFDGFGSGIFGYSSPHHQHVQGLTGLSSLKEVSFWPMAMGGFPCS